MAPIPNVDVKRTSLNLAIKQYVIEPAMSMDNIANQNCPLLFCVLLPKGCTSEGFNKNKCK